MTPYSHGKAVRGSVEISTIWLQTLRFQERLTAVRELGKKRKLKVLEKRLSKAELELIGKTFKPE